ncbi:FecR protein [Aquisphaera giovannonii]|uniref:FecR protein n=1 Tax=Aquisphaera giovannonii TaxID=406548 RepID=A0A5B9W2S8_9BACT|nr:FecR domain-containing protein [Aquisphaera giovannonii]QEH34260.1 FecR protein [Aquisphaera giovannonii]
MSHEEPPNEPPRLGELIELYCDGLIDDAGLRELEALLRGSDAARLEFVRAFHAHTELAFAVRSRRATDEVLESVLAGRAQADPPPRPGGVAAGTGPARRWRRPAAIAGIAAGALLAAGACAWYLRGGRGVPAGHDPSATRGGGLPFGNVAWLLNAQDCVWAGSEAEMPGRDMRSGKILRLRSGLAEIEFEQGARVLLHGPAEFVLLGGSSARLVQGSLTARVPEPARGFTVFSPRGKVIDLGTEFGLSVDEDGATTVRVFEGLVEASPLESAEWPSNTLQLRSDQAARLDRQRAVVATEAPTAAQPFIRSIVPPSLIVPRSDALDFARLVQGSLLDRTGNGTGLTHRLPGTGTALPARDPNLRIDTAERALWLTTTRSDLNTQDGMPGGEYLGFRLADLGLARDEDFEVGATFSQIPGLRPVGQFGLYAGADSRASIRGGLISRQEQDRYNLFLVNNKSGIDQDLNEVGLMTRGQDLRLTLRRFGGRYSLLVENLSRGSSNTLTVKHPDYLDGAADLYVGVFGANPQTEVSRTLTIKGLKATVWTRPTEAAGGNATGDRR